MAASIVRWSGEKHADLINHAMIILSNVVEHGSESVKQRVCSRLCRERLSFLSRVEEKAYHEKATNLLNMFPPSRVVRTILLSFDE